MARKHTITAALFAALAGLAFVLPASAAAEPVVSCTVGVDDPFFRSDATLGTHVNVFCERQVRAIYADVWIEINGQRYEPSVNSGVRVDRDVLNVDSFGAPCDTGSGSSYYGVAFVAISDYDGSIDEGEYESFNGLIC